VLLLLAALGAAFADRVVSRSQRPIVAVSIFDNETGNVRYDRAVHNLSDAVVHRLTQLGRERLGVVGNDAILRMPRSRRDLDEIKAETGASHVVLAQLQPSNGGVTLLVHLIRLDDGTHLWTRRIPRAIDDPLDDLGEEAAAAVEAALRQQLLADSAPELE
jgi:TolB-like protein